MLQHIALQYDNIEKADIFFTKILGLKVEKEFCLSENLSDEIFGIKENVDAIIYGNEEVKFEIFFSKQEKKECF